MHLRPEAGALKTAGSERKVPLHPLVLDLGFLDFVKARRAGPLFFDPSRRRAAAKIVGKNVTRWVHGLGINVGLRVRKAPNHAWRHFFRTSARDCWH
jgi:integrase